MTVSPARRVSISISSYPFPLAPALLLRLHKRFNRLNNKRKRRNFPLELAMSAAGHGAVDEKR